MARKAGTRLSVPRWLLAVVGLLAAAAGPAMADGLLDAYPGDDPAFASAYVFPNWVSFPTASLILWECDDVTCPACTASSLKSMTIMNYGTASAADITRMYYIYECGGTKAAAQTLAYAGVWGGKPAWTWAGTLALPNDPCTACWCFANLFLYTDIGSCPTDGATIALGPRDDPVTPMGGMWDSCGENVPFGPLPTDAKTIRYVMKKADSDSTSPGEPLTYRIYYGVPGSTNPTTVVITDTQPQYTHLVGGSASPGTDPGWDPDPGPPSVLRWTIPGLNPAGGATREIKFDLTVDWGNGESFEPGSGDSAAPEGSFLGNQAHISWSPQTTCAPTAGCCASNTTMTSVKRFLFWKLGDNDMLYQGRLGMPDDEMTYSIFMKNVSSRLTWWNVSVWDTVPPELDAWSPGYGMDDPCTGWTMTPTGCAAASAGRVVSGTNTILTWRVDLPPQCTLELRWRAKVKMSAKGTALNRASIMAYGRSGVAGGTGHSGIPRNFTHEAPIFLRTTYVSYVAYGSGDGGGQPAPKAGDPLYWISFYPLNKATDFALYKKWCITGGLCSGFATGGGRSPRINELAGTCTGGPATDWETGCKTERAPARYVPSAWTLAAKPTDSPFNFLHKIVSNGPVVWELSTCFNGVNQDADTYAGMTNLSFVGYMGYTCARVFIQPNNVDELYIINTDENMPTTVFVFSFNGASLSWDLDAVRDLYKESQWVFHPPFAGPGGGFFLTRHYRVISSDGRIAVHKAYPGVNIGSAWNDFGTLAPNRENGNLVSSTVPANFYAHVPVYTEGNNNCVAAIGSVTAAPVNYTVYRYTPFDTTLPAASVNITPDLVGSAGYWTAVGADFANGTLAGGAGVNANPHAYGASYDAGMFTKTYALYKIKFTSGRGSVYSGLGWFDLFSGGSMLHASKDGAGNPAQAGREFWMHQTSGASTPAVYSITAFCPKIGTYVQCYSGDGAYSLTYTTDDQDEAVSFTGTPNVPGGSKRNYLISVTAAGAQGDIITQYIDAKIFEKFYTAPFLSKGTYYDIITPPVAYVGQSFWITVVVMDTGGGTKTDYAGTTSFTSTDPKAQIQGAAMDAYNFTWNGCGTNCGVRVFVNVVFTQLGIQTMIAADTADGSILGVTSILVVGADVRIFKEPRLMVAASGDTVRFKVCWSNYSSASAFTMVLTDAVPVGTTFLPEASAAALNCGNTDGVPLGVSYSTATTPAMPAAFTDGNPVAGTRWLRWTVPQAGVQTTGCACYRLIVN